MQGTSKPSTQSNAGDDRSRLNTAKDILLGGLALQVIAFGIFCFVAVSYNLRTRREPALAPYQKEMKHIKKLWIAFYVTGILVTGRSIYRTAGRSLVHAINCPDSSQRRIRRDILRSWVR
jgi:hypothetical protein